MKNKLSNGLPALSDHTILRYCSFAILYVAQGIPEGMIFFGIPAWMAMNGKTAAEIGSYTAITLLASSFKIFLAPIIERFTFLPMGRRRPWIIFGQLAITGSLIAMSMIADPLNNMTWLIAIGFCANIFIMFQDIATDALVIDIVPVNEQSKANGFMWGAKIMGTAASLAIGTWLLNHYGFPAALLSLSVAVLLIMLIPLLFRERPGEKLLPWTEGEISADAVKMRSDSFAQIFRSLIKVLKLSNTLIFILASFIMLTGFAFMRTLLPVFTIQALGWTNQQYSSVYATTSLIGGILGMLAGGVLLDRFGKTKMLSIYLVSLIILTAILSFSASSWHESLFIKGYMFLFTTLYTFAVISMFAIAMQLCWKKISALQFTLFMAIYNLGQTTGASLIGPFRNHMNWSYTLLCFPGFLALALLIVQILNIKRHLEQVDKLDDAGIMVTLTAG